MDKSFKLISGTEPIWTIDQLPPLKVWDALAFKAAPGFEEWAIGLEHATTWHWAGAGLPRATDQFGGADYQLIGSIKKGVASELLSAYRYRDMRIYRPRLPNGYQDSLAESILKRCDFYGAYEYDWLGVAEIPLAYLLRYLGIGLHLPVSHRFYCLQFFCQVWADFDFPLYDQGHPVTPYDLETSPQLELIWGTF